MGIGTKKKLMRLVGMLAGLAVLLVAMFSFSYFVRLKTTSDTGDGKSQVSEADTKHAQVSDSVADIPLTHALDRVTKKPFGIYITPQTSPVKPERFRGYHTGADFEITTDEKEQDVAVRAICDGKLLMAKSASGYGGVAVQACTLDGQAVTVIYGHIRLSSIGAKTSSNLKAGDFLANLGTGFSKETDGERKHLHLAIHKGTDINILGYAQSKSGLSGWLDPLKYIQLQ